MMNLVPNSYSLIELWYVIKLIWIKVSKIGYGDYCGVHNRPFSIDAFVVQEPSISLEVELS